MPTSGVVLEPVVNLYRRPSLSADVVTQAILGTTLAVLDSQEGWHHVGLPDQYQGWIEATPVRLYAGGETAYASAGRVAQVDSLFAFLYHEPSVTAHAPKLRATLGARLEVAAEQEGWVQVTLPDHSPGWIQAGDATLKAAGASQPRHPAPAVIATARRLLGLPYLWGGSTPLGIDCSGFVQLAYGLNGVSLLRDAALQYNQPGLAPVAKAGLEPGDLLFFGQTAITHVGLYIGGGEFIHATTHQHPVVQISRLSEPHWTELFQGARRP
jgi:cell wall-associated NlpC family hydrolase